jgi:tRNA(Ile2) C34 agmatinyltransferase TiaS
MGEARLHKWQASALRLADNEAQRNLTAPRFCEECGKDLICDGRGLPYRCPAGCKRPHRAGKHR